MAGAAAIIGGLLAGGGSIAGGVLSRDGGEPEAGRAYLPAGPRERAYRRSLQDIFGIAAGTAGIGAGQLAMVLPELYRELGYEPTIVDRTDELATVQGEVSGIQQQIADLEAERAEWRRKPQSDKRTRRLEKIRRDIRRTEKDLAAKERELTELQAQPIQITGLRPLTEEERAPSAPEQALDLVFQQAIEALRGEVETDPTLLQAFDEQEAIVREGLRRQLGPGYEATTAGIQALTNFQREKAEAIAGYTRDLASTRLQEGWTGATTVSDLVSARLAQGTYLPGAVQTMGTNLSAILGTGVSLGSLLQSAREQRYPYTSAAAGMNPLQIAQLAGMGGGFGTELGAGVGSLFKSGGTTPSVGGAQETWGSGGAPLGAVLG